MVHRIGHVGIRVSDLERSVRHAEEILGSARGRAG